MQEPTMWPDNETDEDLLGFQVHADLIKSLILDGNLLPITIGVFADWGGGKTSIMRIIEKSFDPDNLNDAEKNNVESVLCLYFNGWLFEGYDDAKSALISSVIMSLGEHKRFGHKIKDKCVSLLRSVNWLRVAYLGAKNVAAPAIAAYATGGATIVPQATGWFGWGVNQLKETFVPSSKNDKENQSSVTGSDTAKEEVDWETLIKKDTTPNNPLDIKDFREKFGEMLAKSDIQTLVVLIDDLDRCSPERIVENLEAIKLFLNVEKTAFIIGADPRIVRHAIELKYGLKQDENSEDSPYNTIVNDYLEKLIQYPYCLPKLSPSEIETYISLLFCQKHLSSSDFRTVLSKCNDIRSSNRFGSFGENAISGILNDLNDENDLKKLRESLAITSIIYPLITECLKGNPRQVKRFLNLFELRKKLSEVAHLSIKNDVLVKLMILEYSYHEQYKQLYQWQVESDGAPKILEILETKFRPLSLETTLISTDEENVGKSGKKKKIDGTKKITSPGNSQPHDIPPEWSKEGIKKWLQVDPSLAGIDLRDYFWLTRDRLQTTLTGMVIVSPIIRDFLAKLLKGEKGAKLVASISNMPSEDQQTLCSLIRKEICNKPNELNGYKALGHLIENGITSAVEELLQVFKSVSMKNVPTPIGAMMQLLMRTHGQLPALNEIKAIINSSDDTPVYRGFNAIQS